MPMNISSNCTFFLFAKGSRIAVNNVIDDKHTNVTDTVDCLIEKKNNIQCNPTIAPARNSLIKLILSTLKSIFLNLNQVKRLITAIKTLYQTNSVAGTEISSPRIPVKPHTKTVACNTNKFLLRCPDNLFWCIFYLGAFARRYKLSSPKIKFGMHTAIIGGRFPLRENMVEN